MVHWTLDLNDVGSRCGPCYWVVFSDKKLYSFHLGWISIPSRGGGEYTGGKPQLCGPPDLSVTLLYHPLSFCPSFLLSFLPFFVPPFLPSLPPFLPYLPPSLPSFLPSFLPFCLPSFLPSFLPTFLSSCLPSFPPSLPPSLPSFLWFLPSFLVSLFQYFLGYLTCLVT